LGTNEKGHEKQIEIEEIAEQAEADQIPYLVGAGERRERPGGGGYAAEPWGSTGEVVGCESSACVVRIDRRCLHA
jgi:hypothetical protein